MVFGVWRGRLHVLHILLSAVTLSQVGVSDQDNAGHVGTPAYKYFKYYAIKQSIKSTFSYVSFFKNDMLDSNSIGFFFFFADY